MRVERKLAKSITSALDKYPVIVLTGPRQSGKTTLLKSLLKEYSYISLESPDNRDFAQNDPNGFLNRYNSKVIIDEAQRVPALFSYIQTKVDESQKMGEYILSGSQNFHLLKEITQSLAGRVAIFRLFPFDFHEMVAGGVLQEDYLACIVKGYYPAIYDRQIDPYKYYSNYVQTYLQRDISEILEIRNQSSFKKFLGIVATRAGQLLNLSSIATACSITQPTVKAWLSALESSYIVFTLMPYHENFGKRLVKSPKLYFYDTGLLCYLLRLKDSQDLHTHAFKGALFENMIIAEFVKQMYHRDEVNDIWFWRDSKGHEVDLLYFESNKLHITEIKANQTVMSNLFKGLNKFEEYVKDRILVKQLVYGGNDNQIRSTSNVISWKNFPMQS